MKFIKVVFVSFIIVSCANKSKIHETEYPREVIEAGKEELYDSAKWITYSSNYHYDGITCLKLDSLHLPLTEDYKYKVDTVNFVSCRLKLKRLTIKGDTTIFIFSSYYKEEFEKCYPKQDAFLHTVIFIKNDNFIYRTGDHGYNQLFLKFQKELYENPELEKDYENAGFYSLSKERVLFPEFLNKTKHPLNPWLKKEAVKQGVLRR